MNEFWDVLEIDGDIDEAQILFAHIKDYSLGSIEEDEKIKVYTTKNSKNKINVLINNLNFNNNLHLSWDTIKNENWHLMWKKYFTPVKINNTIEILPDWDYDKGLHKDKIYIRPGMSFGTGHHETTYLMIQALVEYSKKWNEHLKDDLLWPDLKKLMNNYKWFLTFDKKQYRINLLTMIKDYILE